jgi:hypothetical protein
MVVDQLEVEFQLAVVVAIQNLLAADVFSAKTVRITKMYSDLIIFIIADFLIGCESVY